MGASLGTLIIQKPRAVFPTTSCALLWTALAAAGAGPRPPVSFEPQQIASDFGVGYAVASGDVNGDGLTDILAINAAELVWFQAPAWQKHVILSSGATTPDNVALAPHDVDGDGRLDVALGAGWMRENTGTLQWVRQNPSGATPAWEVHPIGAEYTLHRIRWADVDGDRRLELVVVPLHGRGAKAPEWDAVPARVVVFRPPARPRTERWTVESAAEAYHIQHNFIATNLDGDPHDEIVLASKEGLFALDRAPTGTWAHARIGEGAPGEVKLGQVRGKRVLATVEPWHGANVVVYAEQPGRWARTTIESALVEGHALGWADFDGDGSDELVVGWRGGASPGLAVYGFDADGRASWKTVVDAGGMATEDLIVADFDGDRRPDIVASGRSTRNVKIYWNRR
jgi:hypothetical protein